ncbi:MAG: CBS domain-containing protein [Anaerolineales bacterium]|nr:CBS domain-containing protein [Anaerolineales bacterium]
MTTLVRDLMRPALIACPPDATLGEAAVLLAKHRLHALIVWPTPQVNYWGLFPILTC